MFPELIEILSDAGTAGAVLLVFAWLFTKTMKAHREERDEYRKDIKEDRAETRKVIEELTTVIRSSNGKL